MRAARQSTAAGARPGWLPRAYNAGVTGLASGGLSPGGLDLATLRGAVERRVGQRFTPGGDWAFAEAAFGDVLARYRDGIELTPFGRLILRRTALRSLDGALRLQRARQRYPALFEAPIEPPVIIVGLHRSGTTHLHRLLAAHPALRAPRLWELSDPIPHLPRSRWRDRLRRRRMQLELRMSRLAMPDLDVVHHIRVDSFEESTFLLEPSGVLFTAIFAFGAHAYADWLMRHDLSPAYRGMRDILALMGRPVDGGRWLLKCPLSTWHLPALLTVFPDARLIHLHRPLHQSLASVCSFSAVLQRGTRPQVDFHRLGDGMARMYLQGIERAARARRAHPGARVLDVEYADLVDDPQATTDRILRWLDLPTLPAPAGDRPLTAHGGRRTADHIYRAADFGLDPAALEARVRAIHDHLAQDAS